MKLIFSRKGIDDAYGRGASPIFPNGEMISIPIPVRGKEKGSLYKDISFRHLNYQQLIRQLDLPIKRKICHFDPDLNPIYFKRHLNWSPCLGHHGAAAKHLLNNHVSAGDVFLFFGSFKQLELRKYKQFGFRSDSEKRHVIFGYLRIGQILDLKNSLDKQEAMRLGYEAHPHLLNDYPKTNILFVAEHSNQSAGLFNFHTDLVLTKENATKSIWELPLFFKDVHITRHENVNRVSIQDQKTILKTVGIGQDFVVEENKETTKWVNQLIEKHSRSSKRY